MTQTEALDILKLGHNVYLTGSAGSGKTYLLKTYIKYLADNHVEVAVTASTGIAASHMDGITIHSWAGLGIRHTLSEYDLEAMEEKRYLWDRFAKTTVLIIDEISMLHHYRFDLVERVARFFKRNEAPFGGLQVIVCGDFFQLPPVARAGEPEAHFAYRSAAWDALDLRVCYLTESHRHEDQNFISVLQAIRTNTVGEETLKHLRARHNKEPEGKLLGARPTKLYTHNIDVTAINDEALAKVPGISHAYRMTTTGIEALVSTLKNSCLAPETLVLKVGAQMMFVKNNYDRGYVNGTLGTVISCGPVSVSIKTVQGKIIQAIAEDWTIEENGNVKAKITQIPLRLAWAITIHKSQGMTLDAAEIDLGKAFEKGMGYVALSRVRSLEGLKLVGINDKALKVDEEILLFDEDLQEASQETQAYLQHFESKEKEHLQKTFLASIAPAKKTPKDVKGKKISTYQQTKILILEKTALRNIVEQRKLKVETIIDHLETLIEKEALKPNDIIYIKESAFADGRFEEIAEAFRTAGHNLSPVKNLLGPDFSFTELRLARLFIKRGE